ncbi:unnamed protein product, partial [Allacma fusca]
MFNIKMSFYKEKFPNAGLMRRAKILNMFLLSILWFRMKTQDPPKDLLHNINEKIEAYLWNGNKRWVQRAFVYCKSAEGGLNVKHPQSQIQTFRVRHAIMILQKKYNPYFTEDCKTRILDYIHNNKGENESMLLLNHPYPRIQETVQ